MKQKNLEALIKGLERHHSAGTFDLIAPCQYVRNTKKEVIGIGLVRSENELFDSDLGVNFYGVIALLPEFISDGGYVGRIYGLPRLAGYSVGYTVPKWLGILADDLRIVTTGGAGAEFVKPEYQSKYYGKQLKDVTALDVIQLLTEFDRGYKSH